MWYYACFSAILPNHSTLSLSHRVQKTVLYICVSFAVSKYSLFNKEIEMPLNFSYTPYSHIHAPQPRRHHSPDNVVPLCCCLVTKLCPTLCDPVDSSTPGFPPLHHLPEFAQTHVHSVGDAIQPSHPLLSPSPLAFSLSQHQGFFQWVSSSHQVTKVLELQHRSFQSRFRTDFL